MPLLTVVQLFIVVLAVVLTTAAYACSYTVTFTSKSCDVLVAGISKELGIGVRLGLVLGVKLGVGWGVELQVGDSRYGLGVEIGCESSKFGFGWTSCTVVPW